jgi:UDP-N-acetyl-D-mannosaminuronic acid dehydrogenase
MKIAMIGLGYIGLPNALLLARAGHKVLGIDIRKDIVDKLTAGMLPFDEPGLPELFEKAKANFRASTRLEHCDAYIIAVPTPVDHEMRIADLRAVRSAAESISEVIRDGDTVILESTVPPGASKDLILPILKRNGAKRVLYAHCPERAIPGKTLTEMTGNDRIVGGLDKESTAKVKGIYGSFVTGQLFETDETTAEFVKLMENTFRDVNIAIANEFALISEDIGINVWEARELANKHPRVDILKPGPGVGGHCIAIDPLFMVAKSPRTKMIPLAREVNDLMSAHVVRHLKRMLSDVPSPVITLLGLAYKGNVDDARESPAFKVQKVAENEGFTVKLHDPLVKGIPNNEPDIRKAVKGSDALVLITDHDSFKELDIDELSPRRKFLLDTRNILDHDRWRNAGYTVKVLGNGKD